MCVCWGVGRGSEGLETAVVGGVNPTHYNSSLWPVLGGDYRGLQPLLINMYFPFFTFPSGP